MKTGKDVDEFISMSGSIDRRYITSGCLTQDNEGALHMTPLGCHYGLTLYKMIEHVNHNAIGSLELYQNIEFCKLPKKCIDMMPDGMVHFNKRGLRWTIRYMIKNDFNSFVYNETLKLHGVSAGRMIE
jgi:hypothetical protein